LTLAIRKIWPLEKRFPNTCKHPDRASPGRRLQVGASTTEKNWPEKGAEKKLLDKQSGAHYTGKKPGLVVFLVSGLVAVGVGLG
jgi:hypothetical protein